MGKEERDAMSYGKVHVRSTVRTERDYCSVNGEGSVSSNDLYTARSLSSDLGESVGKSNQTAYETHLKGWLK
jgi:hypothetical protein